VLDVVPATTAVIGNVVGKPVGNVVSNSLTTAPSA